MSIINICILLDPEKSIYPISTNNILVIAIGFTYSSAILHTYSRILHYTCISFIFYIEYICSISIEEKEYISI